LQEQRIEVEAEGRIEVEAAGRTEVGVERRTEQVELEQKTDQRRTLGGRDHRQWPREPK
jgi:hypothetical protein